jgi:hypothetical protein
MKPNSAKVSDFTQRETMPSFIRSSSAVEIVEPHMILKPKIENFPHRHKPVENKQQIRLDSIFGDCS